MKRDSYDRSFNSHLESLEANLQIQKHTNPPSASKMKGSIQYGYTRNHFPALMNQKIIEDSEKPLTIDNYIY